ncbi:hypothetical protein NMG60_11006150 [Bertholletia excelsa]
MEEAVPFLENTQTGLATWKAFSGELRKVGSIATPMVVVMLSQYLLQVVSMSMAGHLGQISLSSAAIATSFTNVTGFSFLFGLAGALETLCGQAYGAKQYKQVGNYTWAAAISLVGVCIPVSLLWIFMDKILLIFGQDPVISQWACAYAMWLIPALFPYAILQSLTRFLQSQTLILPMVLCSVATLCFHVPLCWALVFKLEMGNTGAAFSIGLSYWLNAILLGIYLKFSSASEKTCVSFSWDVLHSIGEFFCLAVPSAVMVCLEWWSYEILILLTGLLPHAELETSVFSICHSITTLHYYIPYAFSAAASTRISNELGAGNPRAAQLIVWAVVVLEAAEATIATTALFCCRYIVGHAFNDDKEVVDYVRDITPLICLAIFMDSLQAVLAGVGRGSGWQHIGAYVNLGAYYLIAIPTALVLGFVLHMGGTGFRIGLATGPTMQLIMLSVITILTDWQTQASKARERALKIRVTANGAFN